MSLTSLRSQKSSDGESDYLFVGTLHVGAVAKQKRNSDANKWYKTILIGGEQICCKLDTVSSREC